MRKLFHRNNRLIFLFLCLLALGTATSCDNQEVKNKHPQAKMGSANSAFIDENSIGRYADSIELHVSEYEKRESLIFQKEDHSFHIIRYSQNGKPVLYVERSSDDLGKAEKYYYVDQQQLLLYKENSFNSNKSPRYSSTREFYRNNVLFHADAKNADNAAEFKTAKHDKIEGTKRPADEILEYLEQVINGEGDFDLAFEGITEYPKARYIVLSKDELKAYRAVIRVEREDDFIRELVSNTDKYKGAPLKIDWEIKDGEAVYLRGTSDR